MNDIDRDLERAGDDFRHSSSMLQTQRWKHASAAPRSERRWLALAIGATAGLLLALPLFLLRGNELRDSGFSAPGTRTTAVTEPPSGTLASPATTGTMSIGADVTLTEDHVGTIEIVGSGITLDCNGHSVIASGDEGEWTAGIAAFGQTNVTIKNCHVDGGDPTPGDEEFEEGFAYGILLHDSDGSTIVSNTAINNNHSGISVGDFSNDNIVRDNSASDNLFGFVVSADDNTFTNNTATENVDGFVIHQADYNVFRDNHADQNSEWGFRFFESSFNTLSENTVVDSNAGFSIGRLSSNNSLDRNSADLNTTGFWDASGGGGTSDTANQYTRNTCTGNAIASDPDGLCSE